MDKSKLSIQDQAAVETLGALESAAASLKKIADNQSKSDATVNIVDSRAQELTPIIEAITKAVKGIQDMKGVDVQKIVAPLQQTLKELKIEAPVVNVPAPQVSVAAPKVNVPAPQVTIDPTKAVSDEGGHIYYNGQAYEPQHAPISTMQEGVTTLVESEKTIVIIAGFLMASDPVDMSLMSGDMRNLTGELSIMPSAGFVWPYNPAGWTKTDQGEPLNIEQRANARIGGLLTYIEV